MTITPTAHRRQDAFNGHWVRRGLVYHPVPHDGPTIKAADDYTEPEPQTNATPASHTITCRVDPTLCHCGCLLMCADESCPACLVWAINDAAKHSWTRVQTQQRATHQLRKAA